MDVHNLYKIHFDISNILKQITYIHKTEHYDTIFQDAQCEKLISGKQCSLICDLVFYAIPTLSCSRCRLHPLSPA